MCPAAAQQLRRARGQRWRLGRRYTGGSVSLAQGGRRRTTPSFLTLGLVPTAVWYLVFMAVPLAILAVISLWKIENFDIIPTWNLDNYLAVFNEPVYLNTLLKSLKIAGITTVVSVS